VVFRKQSSDETALPNIAVSSCAAGAWPQIQIVQLCACELIAGQRDVFGPGVRTSSATVAFPVLNDS